MRFTSLIFYTLFLSFYELGIRLTALINPKANKWVEGRKNQVIKLKPKSAKRLWFHCASVGEFEQGRPLIELCKQKNPDTEIILTFFSPSGYETKKNYPLADAVLYLPLDTKKNAETFLKQIQPDAAIFIKYEFWYFFLKELKQRNVPSFLISSTFRTRQIFFRWYGVLFRDILGFFSNIFVQNLSSQKLLNSINIKSEVTFDTRFDRVFQIAKEEFTDPEIENYSQGCNVVIAGSTWQKDIELLSQYWGRKQEAKWIVAPHEVNEQNVLQIKALYKGVSVTLSELRMHKHTKANLLIIDETGILSKIYRFGCIAYVGGGFGASVHNVLEPAVYGIPVLFGPNHKKSNEALDLISLKGAFQTNTAESVINTLTHLIDNQKEREESGRIAQKYVTEHLGGTAFIYNHSINEILK